MNKMLLSAALAGVIAAGAAATAQAADDISKVKCYGIAQAGKNDCKAADGSHACKGLAKSDNSKVDFSLVASKTACTEAHGMTEAPKN